MIKLENFKTVSNRFLFHFTNVYVDPNHYKFDNNCVVCNLIIQNPSFYNN